MADETRNILFNFITDVQDIQKGADAVSIGMRDAAESMGLVEKSAKTLKGAAVAAGTEAVKMAAEWALSGISIAADARKAAAELENVFGSSADTLTESIEGLAGHMGLAEHEATALLAATGALTQSMGMSADESARFSEEMFNLAGDLASAAPATGNAADAMEALTNAANGSTKGLAAWGISLKSSEINARALTMSGKELAAELTQEEKALATLALAQEKSVASQGALNEAIAAGNTEYKEATADIADMQVAVGEALTPIKKLALEGFMVLADVLIALEPAIVAVGEVLSMVLEVAKPLFDIIGVLAEILGGALSSAVRTVTKVLEPLGKILSGITGFLNGVASAARSVVSALKSIKIPSFGRGGGSRHSGGDVPGAPGTLVPILAQGGERVVPGGQANSNGAGGAGGGGATVINITVNGAVDKMGTARQIADLLIDYTQAQGAVDIKVTGN